MSRYLRNDIEFCSCCGKFYDILSGKEVNVPYTEMPADYAILVMQLRASLAAQMVEYVPFSRQKRRKKRH